MAQKVVLYTKKGCVQCKMTERTLISEGIEFQKINLDENPEYIDYIRNDLGFGAAPVVETNDGAWSGFQPAKIKALKNK